MHSTTTHKEAGQLLLSAITNNTTGFVARVDVIPGQADMAEHVAVLRRALARRHATHQRLTYTAAAEVGTASNELGQFAAERRAALAEMLVCDLLAAAKAPGFTAQPLVAHKPQPGLDIQVAGKSYDVKAAGQMSVVWSHQGARGRFSDDQHINFNNGCHEAYTADAQFAGYICVYVYIENEQPVAADVFLLGLDNMGPLHDGTITNQFIRDLRYYKVGLPFPDSKHSDEVRGRTDYTREAYTRAARAAA